jgi:hypothetical protein
MPEHEEPHTRPAQPRHKGRLAAGLVTLALLALIAGLVFMLPQFRAGSISVTDTRAMTTGQILEASGLSEGQHLFKGIGGGIPQWFGLRYGPAEERLRAQFPSIRTVTARLDFPGAIDIVIDERIEVSYLKIPDGCVLVDKEGYALRILPEPPPDIPVIEGISVVQLSVGKSLTVDLPDSMNHALSVMGAIIDADKDTRSTLRILPMVRKIRPVSGRDVYLTLVLPYAGEELTVLSRVSATTGEDMTWLRFAILQGALDGRGKGVLDMTGKNRVFIPDRK